MKATWTKILESFSSNYSVNVSHAKGVSDRVLTNQNSAYIRPENAPKVTPSTVSI